MVNPVRHPVTPNQADNLLVRSKIRTRSSSETICKPQPVQDSVKLSRTTKRESSDTPK